MDASTLVSAAVGLAAALGGFLGGRRTSNAAAVSTAVEVVELLQVQIESLSKKGTEKDNDLVELRKRIEVLESLVTQRAQVEEVRHEIEGVRGVVDRLATKMGA